MIRLIALPIILFSCPASAQTVDTLTNAKAYQSNYIRTPIYGTTTNGNAYTVGFKLSFNADGSANPMDVIRVNLDAHTTSSKTLSYTLSSTSFYWRHVFNSLGEVYLGLNSNNRKILKLNMKDSIKDTNLGQGFLTGLPLAYSMLRGRDGHIYIGGSSDENSTQFSMINYLTDEITAYPAIDEQDYIITIQGDTTFIYLQTGQSSYDFWSFCKTNSAKKKLLTNPIFSNAGSNSLGNFIQQPYPSYSQAVDSSLVPVSSVPAGNSLVYSEFNGANQPTMITFYDDVKGKLYWQKNSNPIDSIDVPNSYDENIQRMAFANLYDTNSIYYLGDYYGIWYKYNKVNNSATALGHVGINMFDAVQVAPSKWYMIGYPSSSLLLWDTTQIWSAETFNKPVSGSTNPKLIGYGRTTSDVHEPQKIVRLSNGLFCFGGNEIRTGNTVGFNWYDSTTNTLSGMNGDNFTPRQYQDMAAWGKNMLLSTSSPTNHGKLFVFDGVTKTLTDSLDYGFKNMGKIFVLGDRLYGIAQDTSNIYQTIDTTRFYIINLSTKEVIYNKKYVGTVNRTQLMGDCFIGINFTRRTAPDQPLIYATLPDDFFCLRAMDNRTYNFNGVDKYYGVQGKNILQYNGITTESCNPSTAQGKEQILMNWLH